ncbi:MAG: chromosomal replication initiator protein DnaA [Defluviitaleaceae bacterium]|nr:chromosomal replication initiator protein DnaA [Defluviitaleaceae bacterium]
MELQPDIVWPEVLSLLRDNVNEPSYSSVIKRLTPTYMDDQSVVLQTPSGVFKSIVEAKFIGHIKNAFHILTELDLDVRITSPEDSTRSAASEDYLKNTIRNKYVFETFVRGKSNDLAYAAAVAVANAPGAAYNPLFLYGGVGLGKTHLMHSIGNSILKKNPAAKVLYCSAETFMNELISSIKGRWNQEFRNKYRDIDVLLIDDIQFLSDKEGTQEEFFHTFNALYDANKQIVISSDQPPHSIKTLEERLSSRFGWGLIVDVKLPDFETRTAILEKKAEMDNIKLPKDVTRFIAKSVVSNIRDLEGALNKLAAMSKFSGMEITLAMADEALEDILAAKAGPEVTVDYIQSVTAKYFGITQEEIVSKKRSAAIAYARQIAMYLVRKLMDISLFDIGEKFGGRHHSTVIHGYDKIADELESDKELRETLVKLEKMITGENE